jgi:hypothetical protein
MSNINSKCSLTAMALSIMSSGGSPVMAADCGPSKYHWIDFCPPGTDTIDTAIYAKIKDAPCDESGSEDRVILFGQTELHRDAGQTSPDHHIDTEITSMVLTNNDATITLRAGEYEVFFSLSSTGRITEMNEDGSCDDSNNGACLANSYIDTFFELDVPSSYGATLTLHNKEAWHKESVIDRVSPIVVYELPDTPISLYNKDEEEVACFTESKYNTLVTIDSFTATASNGAVTIAWETAIEVDNAGFFVWRGQLPAGETACSKDGKDYAEVKQISPFIMAQGSGASYSYSDSQVTSGNTYCYALEDIDLMDKSTFHIDDITSASMP